MSLDLQAVHLALRTRFLTLASVTTGSLSLAATATGYVRTTGSFLTDGFARGMEVTPVGFTDLTPAVIEQADALTLEILGGRTPEGAAGGRSLTLRVPARRAWENESFDPETGYPFVEERFVPAVPRLVSLTAAGGTMELEGLYELLLYSRENTGAAAVATLAGATLDLFPPGTSLPVGASAVRILTRGPYRGQLRADLPGFVVLPVTIPWWISYVNA